MTSCGRVFAILAMFTLASCDPFGDGGWPVTRPLPLPGSYDAIIIDTADSFALLGMGLTDAGQVVGSMGGHVQGAIFDDHGAFRWKDGVLTPLMLPGERLFVHAVNEHGDLVGGFSNTRPILWRHEDPAPVRLFPMDTLVRAVDIADDGQILLFPQQEFSPGASVWLAGEIRPVGAGVAVEPLQIVHGGLIRVRSRLGLSDSVWVTTSPFGPASGSTLGKRCRGSGPVVVRLLDRTGTRAIVEKQLGDQRVTYVATDFSCIRMQRGHAATGFGATGWMIYTDSSSLRHGLTDGSASVAVADLAPPPVDPVTGRTYTLERTVAVNSNGWILTTGSWQFQKKVTVLLRPKEQ